jgi:hypothetical protein
MFSEKYLFSRYLILLKWISGYEVLTYVTLSHLNIVIYYYIRFIIVIPIIHYLHIYTLHL